MVSAFFSGCGGEETDGTPIVARYKGKALTTRQLSHFIPKNVNTEDSTRYADLFIERWLREEAITDEALNYDQTLEEKIDFKVEDYRRKLIIHEYTTRLIQDSLNREIPESEVENYYETHKSEFVANEQLYQYFYISTAETNTRDIRDWMRDDKPRFVDSLMNWSQKFALEYKLDSNYVGESRIREISKGYWGDLKNARPGKLIRWNGVIQGQQRRYQFKLLDVVEPGDPMPYVLSRDKIRRILLNDRKATLIENAEERILKNAKSNNYIEKVSK